MQLYAPKDALNALAAVEAKRGKTSPPTNEKTTFAYDENAIKSSQVGKVATKRPEDSSSDTPKKPVDVTTDRSAETKEAQRSDRLIPRRTG